MKKKIIIINGIILVILSILFILLIIDKMRYPLIYKINSSDKDIKINGIMIRTNNDLFLGLSLDKITTDYYKKELYSKLDNQLLGSTYEYSLVVDNYDLYNKYINKNNSYYLRIYHSNNANDYEDIDLKLELGYKNDLSKNIKKKGKTILDKSEEFKNKILLKMSNELNYYSYKIDNIYYTYLIEENKLIIVDLTSDIETNQYIYDFSNLSLTYTNIVNAKEKYIIMYYESGNSCLEGECKNEKEKLELFNKLIDNLLKL